MEPGKLKPLKRLTELIALERKEITSVYFFAILNGLVQLSVPIGIQTIIGYVMGATMVTSIYVLITLVVACVWLVGVIQINQMKIIEKIQQKLFVRYAFIFADRIPRFELSAIDNYYLPEKVNRFFETLNLQKGLSKLLLDIPIATIQILFGLLLLSFYHPLFIAFGVLLILILWAILAYTGKNGLRTSLQESTYKYAVVAWLEEMARTIRSFKLSHGTNLNLTKTETNVTGYLRSRTAHFNVLIFQYRTLVLFKVFITTGMLAVGTYLLLNQQLNIGEFIAAEIVILTVITAVEKLIGLLDSVYDVITGLEKLEMVTEIPTEKQGKLEFHGGHSGPSIEFIDFNLEYPDGRKALKDLNLHIPANSLVCVSGPEGSGKSSLIRVLSATYNDYSGSLLLNNLPISNFHRDSLHAHTGVFVNYQDLFTGSLWENISLGRPHVTPEEISEIAGISGFRKFLNTFPAGFETEIDPSGKKLPGSVIKKILLLRAIAHKPSLLLMEEPWEGLDEELKHDFIQYLHKVCERATVIVASNDEEFAAKCHYRMTLINGEATIMRNI